MPLSIWEYLRARTRDAVLAGFNDALDLVEQGDSNGSQHIAATQLVTRMKQQAERTLPEPNYERTVGSEPSVGSGPFDGGEPSDGPRPSVHAEPSRNGHAAHAVSELLGQPQQAAATAKRPVGFDDELQQRLDAAAVARPAAPQVSNEKPVAGPAPGRLTERKRRGRPPKNKQD